MWLWKSAPAPIELNPKENVIVPGEQNDIVLSMNHFTSVLVEAKWESAPIEALEVRNFYGKLDSRSPRIIGLIISMSGFTKGAEIEARSKLQKRTIVMLNRQEVEAVIKGRTDFRALFEQK